jgi:hypothetical protein
MRSDMLDDVCCPRRHCDAPRGAPFCSLRVQCNLGTVLKADFSLNDYNVHRLHLSAFLPSKEFPSFIITSAMISFVHLLCLAVAVRASPLPSHVLQHARSAPPRGFTLVEAATADQQMTFRVALKANNISGLEARLAMISDPHSATYRQWLSAGTCAIMCAPVELDPPACRRSQRPHAAVTGLRRSFQCLRPRARSASNGRRRTRRMDVVHDQRLSRQHPVRCVFPSVSA